VEASARVPAQRTGDDAGERRTRPAPPATPYATVLALQRSAGNAATTALIQRMAPCPSRLLSTDPVPTGWKPYYGNSAVFHCGYRGILEDRRPTRADPQNECFYDEYGTLVGPYHRYAGCGGTPNQYDSETETLGHATIDSGGVVRSGPGALLTTAGRQLDQAIFDPVARWFEQGIRGIYGVP
jgi:hypothetical protein